MRIVLIAPSTVLPVPAIKGGAIETLMTGLIDKNEERKLIYITVISPYNKEAAVASKKYYYTDFVWIRYNFINKVINVTTRCYSKITGSKIPHFGVLQIVHKLKMRNFDLVVIEGDDQLIIPISKIIEVEKIYFHLHVKQFSDPCIYTYCNKVIVVSNFIKDQVLLNTRRVDEDVVVLKNCTDINRFSRANNIQFREKTRIRYGISNDDVAITFTGRIVEGKGLKELLQSLLLMPKDLSFKLIIVGSDGSAFGLSNSISEYFTECKNLAKKLNNKVIFTGFIKNSEIPKILAASDIAVVPSTGDEAAGLVIIESMAAGLPIVTTDSGGIPEYINDECALMIRRGENLIQNLSDAIIGLISSNNKRDILGKAGINYSQQYNYGNYYDNISSILIVKKEFKI